MNLDGGNGADSYFIYIVGSGSSLINVLDTGADNAADSLTVYGTDQADNFLLRANSLHTSAFVAALHGDPVAAVERINYDLHTKSLVLNELGGDDSATLDDNLAPTTINGGAGNDHFQVGQIFKSPRDADAGVAAGDVFATTLTTRGYLSNGVSYATTLNGGDNNDDFTVFHNTATLNLNGDDGDDTFTIRAFAQEGSKTSTVMGGTGDDFIQYVINAPVNVDGGAGTNTLHVIGTEFADKFIISKDGIFGAGITVHYLNIQKLIVDGAEGDDQFYVISAGLVADNIPIDVTLYGGLGNDVFSIAGDTPTVVSGLTGQVSAYSNGTPSLTVPNADLDAAIASETITSYNDLVGDTIEISSGPGQGLFWQIATVSTGATTTVFTLQSQGGTGVGLPDHTSNYAITVNRPATVQPHQVNTIQGALHIDGGGGDGSAGGLGTPVMLPGETNKLTSDGKVLAYSGTGTSLSTDTMTVNTADLQATLSRESVPNLAGLVGKTLEISDGSGINRFWLITGVAVGASTTTVLTLTSPGIPAAEWGLPDTTSSFTITHLSPTFFVSEATTRDSLTVFNDGSSSNDVGALSATTLTGLGMAASGITYADLETVEVLFGTGNDTFTVTGTAAGAITAVHGGGGDDHLIATGGGGMASPLLLFGDTTQDRSRYTSHGTISMPTVGFAFANDGNDTIDASADIQSVAIYGGGGNDIINGSQAGDQLAGGPGNDEIHGGPGNDHIYGDAGFNEDLSTRLDFVVANNVQILQVVSSPLGETAGNDRLFGDDGDDIILGNYGIVTQAPGTQRIFTTGNVTRVETANVANAGNNEIHGGTGNDLILGGSGADKIFGDDGNDILFGDNGLVTYVTNVGDLSLPDLIQSTSLGVGAADTIYGNAGNDILIGGAGGDNLYGGNGVGNAPVVGNDADIILGDNAELDHVVSRAPARIDTIKTTDTSNLTGGDDLIEGNEDDDILIGGVGNDRIDGNQGQDLILGDNGVLTSQAMGVTTNPRYRTLSGPTLYDAAGNAQINAAGQTGPGTAPKWANWLVTLDDGSTGLTGNDYLAGGPGNDTIFGQGGNDAIQGDGSIYLDVGTLANVKTSVEDFDHFDAITHQPVSVGGNDGDDYIEGGAGSDLIFGNLGQDDIIGGNSNLFGLSAAAQRADASDTIFGGAGTRIARNDPGDTSAAGHARDADTILGDNGNIFRPVGSGGAFLTFNYDNYGPAKIIPRVFQILDYTPGSRGPPTSAALTPSTARPATTSFTERPATTCSSAMARTTKSSAEPATTAFTAAPARIACLATTADSSSAATG